MSRNTSRKGGCKPSTRTRQDHPPPPPQNIQVRDCMVWPDPTAKAGTPSDRQQHFLPRQPGIGRPRTRGYDMPDNQPHMNKHEDEGTVIQAMRGWPDKSKMQQEQEEEEYGYSNSRPVDQEDYGKYYQDGKNDGDPPMPYLMEHRYIHRPQDTQTESAKGKRGGSGARAKAGIKGTTSSQLRAIHISNKAANSDPLQHRKIPSKLQNIPPHLDTFRRGEKNRNNQNNQGKENGEDVDGGHGPCTCYDSDRFADIDYRFDTPNLEPVLDEGSNFHDHAGEDAGIIGV